MPSEYRKGSFEMGWLREIYSVKGAGKGAAVVDLLKGLGWIPIMEGHRRRGDVHVGLVGSFKFDYAITVDFEKNEVLTVGFLHNVWSIQSATRHPNTGKPIVETECRKVHMSVAIVKIEKLYVSENNEKK